MKYFDVFRSAYEHGFKHGQAGSRRKSELELMVMYPQSLLNKESFISGYHQGYLDGTVKRKFILP